MASRPGRRRPAGPCTAPVVAAQSDVRPGYVWLRITVTGSIPSLRLCEHRQRDLAVPDAASRPVPIVHLDTAFADSGQERGAQPLICPATVQPDPQVVPHRAHPRGLHTEATTEDVTPGASCRAFPRCPGGVAVDVGDAVLIGHQCRSSSGLLWMPLARTATPRPDNVTDRGAGGVRPACPLTSGRAVDARRAAVAPGRAGWRRSPAVAFAPNALMHARPGRASTHLWGRRRVDQPAADSRVRT